jgi:hypothetical protein
MATACWSSPSARLAGSDATRPQLQRLSTAGEHLETLSDVRRSFASPSVPGERLWRWSVALDGTTYVSDATAERSFTMHDTGVWGAMALADLPDGRRFLGAGDYVAMGAGSFTDDRTFRDIRYVDLNNDGRHDIVSNVYGSGCALIAIARAAGGYDVQTPLRNDASCIGGHGETLLVADFDGDGLVDIFLPSYERFDYLKNMGQGRFVEMADALGISFPEYRPNVEGAAAWMSSATATSTSSLPMRCSSTTATETSRMSIALSAPSGCSTKGCRWPTWTATARSTSS